MLHANVYKGNYLNCQDDYITQSVMKETKRQQVNKLPVYNDNCNFDGYDFSKTNVTNNKTSKFDNQKRDI
jgi:hypothetical protein